MKVGYLKIFLAHEHQKHIRKIFRVFSKVGVTQIFIDRVRHYGESLPLLNKLLDKLQPQDIIFIWNLSHLGNSIDDLIPILQQVEEKQARLISIHDHLDSARYNAKTISEIMIMARNLKTAIESEVVLEGLELARKMGRIGGRPGKGISKQAEEKAVVAEKLFLNTELQLAQIAEELHISRSTVKKYLDLRGVKRILTR